MLLREIVGRTWQNALWLSGRVAEPSNNADMLCCLMN